MRTRCSFSPAMVLTGYLQTIYIVLEELIWENIAEPIYTLIHGLSILHRSRGVYWNELNRHVLLVLFLTLFIQVELLGIFALQMIGTGNVIAGTALYTRKIPLPHLLLALSHI